MSMKYKQLSKPLIREYRKIEDLKEDEIFTFQEIIEQAEYFEKLAKDLNAKLLIEGNESLLGVLKTILIGTADTFISLGHSFKTSIFKVFKDLKRSELRYYVESNAIRVKEILNKPYEALQDKKIPFPNKMSSTYLSTTESLIKFLDILDMKNRINALKEHAGMIIDSIILDNASFTAKSIFKSVDTNIAEFSREFMKTQNHFKGIHDKDIKFSKVFKTSKELKDTHDELLRSESKFQEVSSIYYTIQDIEIKFDKLIKHINSTKEDQSNKVEKSTLEALSRYVAFIARISDMYGVAILDLHRVEHNVVEVFKELKREV